MQAAAARSAYDDFGWTRSRADSIRRLEFLARVLDTAVRIPGTRLRLGADSVLGLVPGVGDLAAAALSLYLVHEAHRLGLPRAALARMIGNIVVDAAFGSVPVVGDLFDIVWKANQRNIRILREHLDRNDGGPIIEGTATRLD